MPLIFWISAFNALTFLALAGLHVYWALGGERGLAAALPVRSDGARPLSPSPALTWLVALGLLAFAGLSAAPLGFGPGQLPGWLRLANGVLAAGFALRALGDFRYVGLGKRIRHTTFARRDTCYYTPLCLLLAAGCAYLAATA